MRFITGKLLWGDAMENVTVLAWPWDYISTYPDVGEGSDFLRSPGGATSAWSTGTQWVCELEARWLSDRPTTSPVATGFGAGGGWLDMIEWAWNGGTIRFIPDVTAPDAYVDCVLLEPRGRGVGLEVNATNRVSLKLASTTPFYPALSGLCLDVAAGSNLDALGATFSRASTATYYDARGVRRTAISGALRLECVDTDGDGVRDTNTWLVEKASTNLILQSEALGTTWTATNVAVSSDKALGADGLFTLDKLTENNATNANHGVSQAVTITAGNRLCMHADVRGGERNKVELQFLNGSDQVLGYFDLATAAATGFAFGSATTDACWMEDLGNGIYRCYVVGRVNAGSTAITAKILMHNGTSDSYAGANDSITGLWVGAVQLEQSEFPTSYIPTTTTTQTRALDALSIPLAFNGPKAGQAMTILAEFVPLSPRALTLPTGATNPGIFSLGGSSAYTGDGKVTVDLYRDNAASLLHARLNVGSPNQDATVAMPASGLVRAVIQLVVSSKAHEITMTVSGNSASDTSPTIRVAGAPWREMLVTIGARANGADTGVTRFKRLLVTPSSKTATEMLAL